MRAPMSWPMPQTPNFTEGDVRDLISEPIPNLVPITSNSSNKTRIPSLFAHNRLLEDGAGDEIAKGLNNVIWNDAAIFLGIRAFRSPLNKLQVEADRGFIRPRELGQLFTGIRDEPEKAIFGIGIVAKPFDQVISVVDVGITRIVDGVIAAWIMD